MQGFQLLEQCFRKECGAQELDAPPAQQFQASSILSPNLFLPPCFLASSPLHPARDMVSTKDLALALAASCTSEDKKHSRRRKRTRLWTGGFKIETMTAHSQVHGKSITQFISPAGPCSIIKVSMLALFRRRPKVWRLRSDRAESEEVDESDDHADRDGGIAEAICNVHELVHDVH